MKSPGHLRVEPTMHLGVVIHQRVASQLIAEWLKKKGILFYESLKRAGEPAPATGTWKKDREKDKKRGREDEKL